MPHSGRAIALLVLGLLNGCGDSEGRSDPRCEALCGNGDALRCGRADSCAVDCTAQHDKVGGDFPACVAERDQLLDCQAALKEADLVCGVDGLPEPRADLCSVEAAALFDCEGRSGGKSDEIICARLCAHAAPLDCPKANDCRTACEGHLSGSRLILSDCAEEYDAKLECLASRSADALQCGAFMPMEKDGECGAENDAILNCKP